MYRFHLSTRTSDRLWASTVTLSKGLRTREQEEKVSSLCLLKVCSRNQGSKCLSNLCICRRGSLGTTICNGYPSVIVLVRVLRASTSCANAGAKDQIQLIPFNAIMLSGPALGIGLAGKGF
ncbi:hypothetical protein CK203_110145 [Vitis vinifera]|uniref:Uncharacterized protein n=1 Tax=Vitis vinifera TaxID=29760 RepID=A0A438CB52_VITVI|nr:hypothetical protein CK203_110145 [Vitis vinifera]